VTSALHIAMAVIAFCNASLMLALRIRRKFTGAWNQTLMDAHGIPFAVVNDVSVLEDYLGGCDMQSALDKQVLHDLACDLAIALDGRARIETERRTLVGRDVVELRIFLLQVPSRMTADRWVFLYSERLPKALNSAGLELAVDTGFTPSQSITSFGFWVGLPTRDARPKATHSRRASRHLPSRPAADRIGVLPPVSSAPRRQNHLEPVFR
jgi:hypothetical protein